MAQLIGFRRLFFPKQANKTQTIQAQSGRIYHVLDTIGLGGFGTVHRARICTSQESISNVSKKSSSQPSYSKKETLTSKSKSGTSSESSTTESNPYANMFPLPATNSLGDIQRRTFAIKVEDPNELLLEVSVLSKAAGRPHFCELIDVGIEPLTELHYVVMTMLGPSLSEMRNACLTKRFSFSTSIRVAMQTLHALQQLHEIGFIQRDVKPSNFAIGLPQDQRQRLIHMLDFGISRHYIDLKGEHLPPKFAPGWHGTSRYCSYNNHLNLDLSRRDDIESWFYAAVEMMTGSLPWHAVRGKKNEDKKQTVGELKRLSRTLGRRELLGKCPSTFSSIFDVIDKWGFYSKPDYDGIYVYLMRITKEEDIKLSDKYDWETDPSLMKDRKIYYKKAAKKYPPPRVAQLRSVNNPEEAVIVTSVFGHKRIARFSAPKKV